MSLFNSYKWPFWALIVAAVMNLTVAHAGPDEQMRCKSLFSQNQLSGSLFRGSINERGNYSWSESYIEDYYLTHPEVDGLIQLQTPLEAEVSYKINDRGEFQAASWENYLQQLKWHQHRWAYDHIGFTQQQKAGDFNQAKIDYYSGLDFDFSDYRHDGTYYFMREWGGLNHPPFENLESELIPEFSANHLPINYQSPHLDNSSYFDPHFHKQVDEKTGSEMTRGNSYRLLADRQSFIRKKELIQNAKTSVLVSSLVFVEDTTTTQMTEILQQKAKAGIDVRVLVEKSLSYLHPLLLKNMLRAGVKLVYADDFANYNSQAIYHTKVILVDGEVAITGGQNMLDADLGSEGTDFKNRDLDVESKGPVVLDMMTEFMKNWNHFVQKENRIFRHNQSQPTFTLQELEVVEQKKAAERANGQRGASHYQDWLSDKNQRMKGLGRYISQKPYENQAAITDTYIHYLENLTTHLSLTNALALDTFKEKPGKSFKNFNRLFLALKKVLENPEVATDYITSGGDYGLNEAVSIVVERIFRYLQSDRFFMANMNELFLRWMNPVLAKDHFQNLLRDVQPHPATNIWIHTSFIHSKVATFDRIAASIGSFNWHHNATDQAYESTLFIQDEALMKEIDRAMVLDMANSVPLVFKGSQNRAGEKK